MEEGGALLLSPKPRRSTVTHWYTADSACICGAHSVRSCGNPCTSKSVGFCDAPDTSYARSTLASRHFIRPALLSWLPHRLHRWLAHGSRVEREPVQGWLVGRLRKLHRGGERFRSVRLIEQHTRCTLEFPAHLLCRAQRAAVRAAIKSVHHANAARGGTRNAGPASSLNEAGTTVRQASYAPPVGHDARHHAHANDLRVESGDREPERESARRSACA